ncbi:MAG: DoxX family protein, partial [Chitinophagaceae bacterium]
AGLPKIGDGFAPEWFEKQVDGIGFSWPSPLFWATVASWGEFVGGLLLAFGLLTRLMALQLAFQFFVIAFMWYDEPAPLTGMYYQQLLFWGFVLVLAGGGGRFSIDNLLLRGFTTGWRTVLRRAPAITAALLLLVAASATAQVAPKSEGPFAPYFGTWAGKLQYLDYSSNKQVFIKAEVRVVPMPGDPARVILQFSYPGEPGHEESDTLAYEGPAFGAGGPGLKWKTAATGKDAGKPALLLHSYKWTASALVLTKEVQWDRQPGFFMRNQYVLHRVTH